MSHLDAMLSAAHLTPDQILKVRVDRENEISTCLETLVNDRRNLLVFGDRGAGKTFLMKLLCSELAASSEKVLPVYLDIMSSLAWGDAISSLPRAILMGICRSIWYEVLDMGSSDLHQLAEQVVETVDTANDEDDDELVVSAYRFVASETREFMRQRAGQFGVSGGVRAIVSPGKTREYSYGVAPPHAYSDRLRDLTEKILVPRGYGGSVVICDEANKLPILQQVDLLENFFSLFQTSHVRFVFVAGLRTNEELNVPKEVFGHVLELGGLPGHDAVEELIDVYCKGSDLVFTKDATEIIWDAFKGHPLDTLDACKNCLHRLSDKDTKLVDARVAALSCLHIQSDRYERRLRERLYSRE